jgi:hypothetical protein
VRVAVPAAGDHGSQFSERDVDKLDEATLDYLYAQLALLVMWTAPRRST